MAAVNNALMLAGRYTVDRIVGRGGMSTVYRAYDTHFSNRVVAVKEMVDTFATPEERAEAERDFLREADLLAALRHQAIPAVFDRFSANSRHYLVMEYIAGENLEVALAARSDPYSETQVRTWALELCAVLRYLHDRQPPIIFRDLKPGNILVEPGGRLRLIDFGIARFFKHSQSTDTTALGTSGYASPEHYTGQTDARSDIYSLAATLHHLLTLRDPSRQPPFQFPPVRSINATASPELEAIITKGLSADRGGRFATVPEVEAALQGRSRAARSRPAPAPGSGSFGTPPFTAPTGPLARPGRQPAPSAMLAPGTLVLVITRMRRGADMATLANELAPLTGQTPAEAAQLLRRLPLVVPLVAVSQLGSRLKRLRDLGTDAQQVVPATESVNLDPTLQRELLTNHQIVIWDVKVGAGRSCYCRRCGHRWMTSKAAGDAVPQQCYRCGAKDWSRRRLCKCAWCGHEFEVNDYRANPERLRPFCECCGLRDWLQGRRNGWQGLVQSFRELLGLPG
ncbi:MAG: serine/threonine protein kinase [Chloroflexi bacterium]|nr:serine/threonine protein kinase [Chloroflexota bacterium]